MKNIQNADTFIKHESVRVFLENTKRIEWVTFRLL